MVKTRKKGELVKTSDFVKKELSIFEEEVVVLVMKKAGITREQAIDYLEDDDSWETLIDIKKKSLDLDLLELVQDFKIAVKLKTEKGSLEQARAGMTGIAIAYDKVFGVGAKKGGAIFKSDNINVNMKFDYKKYKTKKRKK